jgi:hypothetical protein
MKTSLALVLLASVASVQAFVPASTTAVSSITSTTALFGYIPDGFTAESYKKFKAEEAKKQAAKKNLGQLGPKGFKSRSFQSFQEALERGEAAHLMPVFNAKEKLKRGEIKLEDIPYMQRGGAWDNSDVKGAQRKKWLSSDKEYSNGGFRKEQSVSIFGKGEGLDWTGTRSRRGPESVMGAAPKFAKNYKPPNINAMKGMDKEEPPKKKLFGLF